MEGFSAEGKVVMDDAKIGGQLICTGGSFVNAGGIAITADRTSVGGSVHFKEGFTAKGEVRMLGADITGPLVCTDGRFENTDGPAFAADRASILGGLHCAGGFTASGEVRLPGSRIGNGVNCAGGKIINPGDKAITLESAMVTGDIFFSNDFVAEGEVKVRTAHIKGAVVCNGGKFINPEGVALVIDGTSIDGSLHCGEGFVAEGDVILRATTIGGQLGFSGKASSARRAWDLEGVQVKNKLVFTPSEPVGGGIRLANARVGRLHDNPHTWSDRYELDGLRYGALRGAPEKLEKAHWWEQDPGVKARLAWLGGNESGYQPQIFDQLAKSYGDAGLDPQRRRVLIEKQRRRRGHLALPAKAWNLVEDMLVGFGYRTWQALIPFAALVIVGVFFFAAHRHEIVPKNAALETPSFHPLTYTLDLLVPVVTLGLRENYTAQGCAQTVSTVFIVAGWILTTAIIAALTGLVRRTD
jgi:hypothetical protein